MKYSGFFSPFFWLGILICLPWQSVSQRATLLQPTSPSLKNWTLVIQKTVAMQQALDVQLNWQTTNADRSLRFPWSTEQDSLSLSFIPQIATACARSVTRPSCARLAQVSPPNCGSGFKLPLFGSFDPEPGAISLESNGEELREGQDWSLCGRSLQVLRAVDQQQPLHVHYRSRPHPRLRFPLAIAEGAPPYSLEARRLDINGDAQPIKVRWQKGQLIFEREDYREGSTIVVDYREAYLNAGQLHIPHPLQVESLAVKGLANTCRLQDLILEKQILSADCSLIGQKPIQLAYRFATQTSLIDLSDLLSEESATRAQLRIAIDGEDFAAYKRSGPKVLLIQPSPQAIEAKLEISLQL